MQELATRCTLRPVCARNSVIAVVIFQGHKLYAHRVVELLEAGWQTVIVRRPFEFCMFRTEAVYPTGEFMEYEMWIIGREVHRRAPPRCRVTTDKGAVKRMTVKCFNFLDDEYVEEGSIWTSDCAFVWIHGPRIRMARGKLEEIELHFMDRLLERKEWSPTGRYRWGDLPGAPWIVRKSSSRRVRYDQGVAVEHDLESRRGKWSYSFWREGKSERWQIYNRVERISWTGLFRSGVPTTLRAFLMMLGMHPSRLTRWWTERLLPGTLVLLALVVAYFVFL